MEAKFSTSDGWWQNGCRGSTFNRYNLANSSFLNNKCHFGTST